MPTLLSGHFHLDVRGDYSSVSSTTGGAAPRLQIADLSMSSEASALGPFHLGLLSRMPEVWQDLAGGRAFSVVEARVYSSRLHPKKNYYCYY